MTDEINHTEYTVFSLANDISALMDTLHEDGGIEKLRAEADAITAEYARLGDLVHLLNNRYAEAAQ